VEVASDPCILRASATPSSTSCRTATRGALQLPILVEVHAAAAASRRVSGFAGLAAGRRANSSKSSQMPREFDVFRRVEARGRACRRD
jgi:hypothetical protein